MIKLWDLKVEEGLNFLFFLVVCFLNGHFFLVSLNKGPKIM
jgi:hypothetical protein